HTALLCCVVQFRWCTRTLLCESCWCLGGFCGGQHLRATQLFLTFYGPWKGLLYSALQGGEVSSQYVRRGGEWYPRPGPFRRSCIFLWLYETSRSSGYYCRRRLQFRIDTG
ncbi:unnamed protein product, partial [Ectocarpus fasciculatus]